MPHLTFWQHPTTDSPLASRHWLLTQPESRDSSKESLTKPLPAMELLQLARTLLLTLASFGRPHVLSVGVMSGPEKPTDCPLLRGEAIAVLSICTSSR